MKPIEILLVEDNPGDARLTREALTQSKVRNTLHHARDGEEAMAFLRREGRTPTRRAPDLSCSTSTCRAATAARCSRTSRATRCSCTSRSSS